MLSGILQLPSNMLNPTQQGILGRRPLENIKLSGRRRQCGGLCKPLEIIKLPVR